MPRAINVRDDLGGSNAPAAPVSAPYGNPTSSGAIRYACPMCKGALMRIWRRPIDRLSSQFVPVHRFRCERFSCGWEGNLRVDGTDKEKKVGFLDRAVSACIAALVLVTSVALAVMLVVAIIGWFSANERGKELVGSTNNLCETAIYATIAPTFSHCSIAASTG